MADNLNHDDMDSLVTLINETFSSGDLSNPFGKLKLVRKSNGEFRWCQGSCEEMTLVGPVNRFVYNSIPFEFDANFTGPSGNNYLLSLGVFINASNSQQGQFLLLKANVFCDTF